MPGINIEVGPWLFSFRNYGDWINSAKDRFARSGYTGAGTVCVDAKGRACISGREFERAQNEGTYPIKVYALTEREL